jgi:ppGpp synthetase/RelA/SpoT-type nucleotidyltranferase
LIMDNQQQELPKKELHKMEIAKRIEILKETHADEILKRRLCSTLDKLGIPATVNVRVKTLESALKKMNKRQFSESSRIMDLLGGMIITNSDDLKDIYAIKNSLCKNYSLCAYKDYYENPKKSGYRSLHLCLNMEDVGVVEIHLDTIGMSKAQKITHDAIYKSSGTPQGLDDWLISMSKKIYDYYAMDYSLKEGDHQKTTDSEDNLLRLIEQEKSHISTFDKGTNSRFSFLMHHQFQKKVLAELTFKITEIENHAVLKNKIEQPIPPICHTPPIVPVAMNRGQFIRNHGALKSQSFRSPLYQPQFTTRKMGQPHSIQHSIFF